MSKWSPKKRKRQNPMDVEEAALKVAGIASGLAALKALAEEAKGVR